MSSAWGKSWGSAWGNSWGAIATEPPPRPPSGGASGGLIISTRPKNKKPIVPIDLSGRHVGAHYATGTLRIEFALEGEHTGKSSPSGLVSLSLTLSGIAQSTHESTVIDYELSLWKTKHRKKKREEQALILTSIALMKSNKRK